VLSGKDIPHEVVILRDGFSQFQVKYKVTYSVIHSSALFTFVQDDPELVENWNEEVWASDWS
jgi:Cdc25 family phosphatase